MSVLKSIQFKGWTAYTPTVTSGTGTFTAVAATGRYYRIDKLIFLEVTITITTNGTAATSVSASLPFSAAAFQYAMAGRNNGTAQSLIYGNLPASTTTVTLRNPDSTYPGADGYVLAVSGFYEVP